MATLDLVVGTSATRTLNFKDQLGNPIQTVAGVSMPTPICDNPEVAELTLAGDVLTIKGLVPGVAKVTIPNVSGELDVQVAPLVPSSVTFD